MFDTEAKVPVYRATHNGRDFAFIVTVSATKENECHLMPGALESIERTKMIIQTDDDVLVPFGKIPSVGQISEVVETILSKIATIPLVVFVSRTVEGAEVTMGKFAEWKDIKLAKEV